MNNEAMHRQVGPGVFACGAKAADGARGTPRPALLEQMNPRSPRDRNERKKGKR